MNRSSSFWFGGPKEGVSATVREKRLEQHILRTPTASSTMGSGLASNRSPARGEQRDPQDFKRGVDVQELTDVDFARLFPSGSFAEAVGD